MKDLLLLVLSGFTIGLLLRNESLLDIEWFESEKADPFSNSSLKAEVKYFFGKFYFTFSELWYTKRK